MIINNKYLNSKPVYELPFNTKVCLYVLSGSMLRGGGFKEDISISCKPPFTVREVKHPTYLQVLVRSDDVSLLAYLRGYDYNAYKDASAITVRSGLYVLDVKKIISDYYMGLEDDNK